MIPRNAIYATATTLVYQLFSSLRSTNGGIAFVGFDVVEVRKLLQSFVNACPNVVPFTAGLEDGEALIAQMVFSLYSIHGSAYPHPALTHHVQHHSRDTGPDCSCAVAVA